MNRPPVPRAQPHPCSTCTVQRSFCSLPEDLRAVFDKLKTSAAYAKGEVAFHESDLCHSVFVLCQGSLKLVTASSEGKVLLLRFAVPGDLLGAAEALRGDVPYECTAIAAEPSVLAIVPRDTFLRFIGSYARASLRLVVALSEQYKALQQETKFLAFGETSTARLARLLLDWSARCGNRAVDGARIPSHITHTELAQSIGATRETVTRVLGNLSHRGIVERRPDEIVIHCNNELERLGAY